MSQNRVTGSVEYLSDTSPPAVSLAAESLINDSTVLHFLISSIVFNPDITMKNGENEDIGGGATVLNISFMSPEDFGYDLDLFRPPNVLTAINANAGLYEEKTPLVTFTHVAREIPGGLELRSRFWLGWQIIDKNPVKVQEDIPLELISGLAYHCPKEYTNLAAILPQVYAENVNIIDKIEVFQR